MAKKQQMRWSDEGAHALALVRVADLNDELSLFRVSKGRFHQNLRDPSLLKTPQISTVTQPPLNFLLPSFIA
jgi:hypothetical protein